ncbi:ABC transporter substrate-binding protein [Halobacterium zhouii]|uniref:ABC transporter substrate-binding protein n=1 Tax=Halobacterium zhouii TaxID=2902624 RepID=UPI001E404486|nr:ABC transporter substrate-binding protein [Halobacterium zhouii]
MSDNPNHSTQDESQLSRRTYLTAAAAAGSAGIAGCLGMGGDSSGSALEVLHAWTGGDGERAINALTSKFKEQHPDMKTDFRPIGGGGNTNLNTVMSKRLGNNNPPSSFAGWPGANLTQYEGILGDASEAWKGLEDKHIEEAVSLSKYDGTFRAMPIGSHRLNDLFYNKKVLEEAGVNPEDITSHSQLISALEKVGQNTDKVPMAQGMKLPWTTLQLFAVTLLSTQGYQAYMDFTKGNGDKAKVTDALESTKQILNNHVNDDASSIGLTGALDKIMSGNAAFIHQGNWAAGAFGGKENFEYGEDWGHITYPGTQGMYTLHIDSFIKPGNNPSPEKTTKWLSFAGTKEAQIAFNTRKGSIPTRTDIGTSEFGDYLTNTIEEFQNADEKPPTLAHGLAVSASTLTKLKGDINDNFTGPYNVDAAADAMLKTIGDGQA